MTICPSKYCLGYSSLEFVGHMVVSDRIAMEEDKLDRIQDAPKPETKKRSLLGLAGYYRKFLPN